MDKLTHAQGAIDNLVREKMKQEYPALSVIIDQILYLKRWEQWDLAREIGADQSRISRWMRGDGANAEYTQKLRDIWIELQTEQMGSSPSGLLPIIGKIGSREIVTPEPQPGEIELTFQPPPGFVGLLVEDDSLFPSAEKGEVIIFGPEIADVRDAVNKHCVVKLDGGQHLFRIVMAGSKDGLYNLVSHNAPSMFDVRIISCRIRQLAVPRYAYKIGSREISNKARRAAPKNPAKSKQKKKPPRKR